jgi:hypothetical protein
MVLSDTCTEVEVAVAGFSDEVMRCCEVFRRGRVSELCPSS